MNKQQDEVVELSGKIPHERMSATTKQGRSAVGSLAPPFRASGTAFALTSPPEVHCDE